MDVRFYATRDADGTLKIADHKLVKFNMKRYKKWVDFQRIIPQFMEISSSFLPEVKWEDEEPTELILTVKR